MCRTLGNHLCGAALKSCRLHRRCPAPLSLQALSTLTLSSCKHPQVRRPCLSPATHPPTHSVTIVTCCPPVTSTPGLHCRCLQSKGRGWFWCGFTPSSAQESPQRVFRAQQRPPGALKLMLYFFISRCFGLPDVWKTPCPLRLPLALVCSPGAAQPCNLLLRL